ncbi:hypothetical protein STCU_02315 [Strigomonas culicis]|uniref:Uncharacterized protein n=1 Tax=Strigomonas culicis TaxID=28005 RepID=S9UWQ8_9TRYP|nr:hypothetical protein STCU_02315 [Strigomonas culicis]|eukprot:EPY33313.1 hypothetical protein STCU_02315 [Strigomonas culicis]
MCHTAHRCGKWLDALWLCDFLEGEPPPIFLSSLLTPDNVQPILSLCATRGWPLDVANAIRELSGRHGSWAAALAVARDAEARFPTGESYAVGTLVPYLAASGHQAEAHQLFRAGVAHGALVDAAFVQGVLRRTVAAQQWQTCLFMLETLGRTFETAPLLPRDAEFYTKVMEMTPCWLTALRLFALSRAAEVRPDKRLVSALLTQCDEAGAWAEATRIYDLAVQEGFRDSFATGSTYHTLVRAFAAVRQWEKALEALSWMSKASHASTIAGRCELVEICEHAGQWEAALAVGCSLLEDQPELLSSQTMLSLLLACAKGGQWQTATRIFRIQQADVRVEAHPLSVCAVLQSCIAANRWAEALAVFREARQQQPRTVMPPMAHRLAVKACVGAGKWSQVMSLLEVMRRDGLPYDNNSQRLGMWAAALEGQWELSLAFLKRIPPRTRTLQDRLVVRSATRYVSPTANAIALRYLQTK